MQNNFNIFVFIGFVLRVIAILIIALYIVPKSFIQVLRPKDWLTKLRWLMLLMFTFTIIASVPSMVYQLLKTNGVNAPGLMNLSNITGNLSFLAISILLVLIYNYRKKE